MVRESNRLWLSLSSRVRHLDRTRRRVDSLVLSGHMSRPAAEQMYESLFLGGFTAFEVFLEEVFLALLIAPTRGSRRNRAVPRLTIRSIPVARELVFGPGRKYVDWLPFERTAERARVFFRGGRPFVSIVQPQIDLINKAQLIRNAIAHHSRHSIDQFERRVIAGAPVPPRERKPGGYLRGLLSASPPLTRYENLVTGLLSVARNLT